MKKAIYILIGVVVMALAACDNIKEEERLIYVAPAAVARCILIEDFTGQRCVNCPDATEELETLQKTYGADTVIVVGIHSGPFGVKSMPNPNYQALATDLGDEYYAHWGIEAQPGVMINRHGSPVYDPKQYASFVSTQLKQSTPLSLSIENTNAYVENGAIIVVKAKASELVAGKLQVWVVEDSIQSVQLMPNNNTNLTYIHDHVFRASVTEDIYGDDIQVSNQSESSRQFTIQYGDKWVKNHLYVVAFVYNSTGVIQATRQKIVPSAF